MNTKEDPLFAAVRLLGELQNPQRQTAILSAHVPHDKAIRRITGQRRITQAKKCFEEFLPELEWLA
jgi:hypothetical protein